MSPARVVCRVNFFVYSFGSGNKSKTMDFITSAVGSVNWELIFQLTFVALIMIAGPVVIFLLAFNGGDL